MHDFCCFLYNSVEGIVLEVGRKGEGVETEERRGSWRPMLCGNDGPKIANEEAASLKMTSLNGMVTSANGRGGGGGGVCGGRGWQERRRVALSWRNWPNKFGSFAKRQTAKV